MITKQSIVDTIVRSAEMVREFHEVYGHPVGVEPSMTLPERRGVERYTYLLEELLEGTKASLATDKVEVVDALGDSIYFSLGNIVECGVTSESLGEVVSEIIASMAIEEDIAYTLSEVESAGGWARWMRNVFIQANFEITSVIAKDATHELPESEVSFTTVEPSVGLILSFIFSMKVVTGADPLAVMSEIHRSNMSKLLPDTLPNEDACHEYMKSAGFTGSLDGLMFRRMDDMRWVVKNIDNGKVVKNPNYSKADLTSLVPAH
ncbi:pyrophosphohydrolase domain-containing protein [Vreelandella sulfidaeris]|uniref:Uncharacterized protein n=1 Tax=Vreelandella sulfidaeris TaxID=115553 RepID=A0A455U6K1_9GAMM|nr:hypothetical protein HSBAA_30580 [Halomonas sulfidaeris]